MNKRKQRILDGTLIVLGLAALVTTITRYQMPFRLDDVLYMQWAQHHSIWDAFHIQRGEIFMSVRPVISITFWLLTHYAGTEHYWIWHFVLAGSFLTAIGFTGLTARYISRQSSALYISSIWYWLAFLPILNILFWYADITFALEMMFCSMAWYFGLRALFEHRTAFWVIANIVGILAAMTKEPSLLLIHGVFIGTIILKRKEFLAKWKLLPYTIKAIWIGCYIAFLAVSLQLFFISQAKQNRFFHFGSISSEQLQFFVTDRIRYYSEVLTSIPLALYLFISSVGLIISSSTFQSSKIKVILFLILTAIVWVAYKPLLIILFLLVFITAPLIGDNRNKRLSVLSLFGAIASVNALVLLITVMLVKTQLAELSFLLSILGASGASIVLSQVSDYISQSRSSLLRYTVIGGGVLTGCGLIIISFPKLQAKEQLLRDVRSTRLNTNNAIQWMARSLPQGANVAVTAPSLYGIGSADDLTSKEDEYKLYAQYTFLQGFIFSYFDVLGRNDVRLAYLEDSIILPRVLDSCRSVGGHYLFLQTGLDIDRFHGSINHRTILNKRDSLLVTFSEDHHKGIGSELWLLRRE